MRNPWGHGEWTGAWSSQSKGQELKKYKNEILAYIETLDEDEEFDMDDENDGIFFMLYEDFKDIFSCVFINIDFPEKWTGVRFKSKWTKENSLGLPTSGAP